jgi:flagella basal body P-ring formation protein FlgA
VIFRLVLLLLVACSASAQDAQPVRIDLRPATVARHAQVVLGEVADIHADDLGTMRQLVSLPLGERARAGSDSILRRDVLERWVRLRLGIGRADIVWGGAPEAVVRTPAQEMHAVRPEPAARVAVSATAVPAEVSVARGDWVSLHLKTGSMELETRVQALQDGRVGDVVRVRAPAATETVQARVVSSGHVEALL